MMNPFKVIWRGLRAGGRGMRVAYRQVTRPEVMAALQIGGMFIPGVNALGMLTFLQMVKRAEHTFPRRGFGTRKAKHVLAAVLEMTPQLDAWGVPASEWNAYLEGAVLLMQGRASLIIDVDGNELLEEDLESLAALFDEAAKLQKE